MKINRQQLVFTMLVATLLFWAYREGKKRDAKETKVVESTKK